MSGLFPLARAGGQGLKAVFAVLRLFRPDRPIHRSGVLLHGTLTHTRVFSGEQWLDSTCEEQVLARISRSVGLPDALPDVVGLALRIGDADVLLATTGRGAPGRFMVLPRRSVVDGPFTSLMPFRGAGGPVLLAARREGPGQGLGTLSELRSYEGHLQWGLFYSHLRGPWTRCGTLNLRISSEQSEQPRFDPVGCPPAGLGTYPWTRALRVPSYALAQKSTAWLHFGRENRSAESDPWKPTTRFPLRTHSRRTSPS
ncbi:hypothetical protein SAMN04488693_11546 [Arthrobacter subterraneus]|uniref:Phosphodiesterase n=1 Tax=Arthrobacter subterraneus TaxID=335973 RepID=A0A1G8LXP9_9MICC|nr:hypothetical protein [Arthrobacter subterraneus]SDI60448.1 hypothetical protein SAMN04488693_11546 [Arthrobacter subterraneus]